MEYEGLTEEEILNRAEELIDSLSLEGAQSALDAVKEESARKFYLQSRIYKIRCWYNEQRKQLKKAVKAEPENETYKKELEELEAFRKTPEYKHAVRKHQMGQTGGFCAELGAECCAYCCCEAICEGIGSGC